MDVNEELKLLGKFTKKFFFGGWGVGGGVWPGVGLVCGGQGGCERRIEVFVKIQKKLGGGVVGGGGGCWVGVVRGDVNEELKFL